MAGPGVLWSVVMWQGGVWLMIWQGLYGRWYGRECMVDDIAEAVWLMIWQRLYG